MERDRTTYCGGPDAAAILGFDRYRTGIDVVLAKKKQAAPLEQNWPMRAGLALEPVILDDYAERHALEVNKQPGFVQHPKLSWAGGSVDGWVPKVPRIAEVKTTQNGDEWGEAGTDHIPQRVLVQAHWYMPLWDVEECDVIVLIRSRDLREYRVRRDYELEKLIFSQVGEFWDRYIIGDEVPPLDGSESAARYIQTRYPRGDGRMLTATPEIDELVAMLRQARTAREKHELLEAALETRVKSVIGDADGIETSLGKITWRKSSDSKRLDSKALQADPEAAALVARHTMIIPGSRRFVVPRDWGKEKDQ